MKVETAFLHQAVTIPGYSKSEKTLNQTKLPGIEMDYGPQGLSLIAKNKAGKTFQAIIPSANVAIALLAEDTPKKGK